MHAAAHCYVLHNRFCFLSMTCFIVFAGETLFTQERGKLSFCMWLHNASALAYMSLLFLDTWTNNVRDKSANAWGLRTTPCIGILFPYLSGSCGPEK